MNPIVIYHKADYDGIFCREIAKKFMPEAELIGWDYGDEVPNVPEDMPIFMLDISIVELMDRPNLVWIDHHKSAIEKYPDTIKGYRIDGVAACRLAWQWFSSQLIQVSGPQDTVLPTKKDYLERTVAEPISVRLAGEYDIWDHRGDGDLEFQFGLDCQEQIDWNALLSCDPTFGEVAYTQQIVQDGRKAMQCYATRDASIVRERSFVMNWEGLKFLCLNTARCNSNTFAAKDEEGIDALMAFFYDGKQWKFSLYHSKSRRDLDLSKIAVKYGGGGHRGACGFQCKRLPFK